MLRVNPEIGLRIGLVCMWLVGFLLYVEGTRGGK